MPDSLPFDPALFEFAPALRKLPVDPRGYPIPWFAAHLPDGGRDLRVSQNSKRLSGYMDDLCWICGEKLEVLRCFCGGPLSIINRVFSDWAMHPGCGQFSVRACPFLNGRMVRRNHAGLPVTSALPGHIDSNEGGACALYFSRGRCHRSEYGHFLPSAPVRVEWFKDGLRLTDEEAASILEAARQRIREMVASGTGVYGRRRK